MKKIFITLFVLFSFNSFAFPQPDKPKLVVGIVIDQMNYDYFGRYMHKFCEGGFKRLYNNGLYFKNTNITHFPTYTAPGHTSLYTGTVPAYNGIVGNNWIERFSKSVMYCASDKTVTGVGTSSKKGLMSPRNMLTSTVTDQLKIATNFKAKVIGIALKDRGGIFPAGHYANAAYWYDLSNECWITSSYYMAQLPDWVEKFNAKKLPAKYLSEPWNTLYPIDTYIESTPDDVPWEYTFEGEEKPVFPHNLPALKSKNEEVLQYSPFGNTLTKDFAIDCIVNENLGRTGETDFLAISFSSTDYVGHMYGPHSVEVQDTYLRIDKELAELFTFIDEFVGEGNTLYFLTADHGNCTNPMMLKEKKYDAGAFYNKKILAAGNEYMQKTFGVENIALRFFNQQFYFDMNVITDNNLNISEVSDSLARFVYKNVEGVRDVFTSYQLKQVMDSRFRGNDRSSGIVSFSPFIEFFKNGFYEPRSGDVIINFKPGWIEDGEKGTEHGSPYPYDTHIPLMFFGWKITKDEISDYVRMVDVAPTISAILNIDFPNGNIGTPIKAVMNNIGHKR